MCKENACKLTKQSKVSEVVDFIKQECTFFNESEETKKASLIAIDKYSEAPDILLNFLDRICECYSLFVKQRIIEQKEAVKNLNSIIKKSGMLYEAIAYYWMSKTTLISQFTAVYQTSENVSSKNVDLDGCIDNKLAFDIKTFQFYGEMIDNKLNELREKYQGYVFLLTGDTAIDRKQFWDGSAERTIQDNINNGKEHFIVELPNGGCISVEKRKSICMSTSFLNSIKWCENMSKFPLARSNQFTTKMPFMQIEVFDKDKLPTIENSIYLTLRILARRIFFESEKNENKIKEFCKKIDNEDLTVSQALKCLSAICFMDINTGDSWFFSNPFATNIFPYNIYEHYKCDHPSSYFDNFCYDNY